MTTILAIDTATSACSVAIWHEGRILAYLEELKPNSQSARLLPMAEEALRLSGLAYPDLTAVACTIGPGSFTGIRVGLAAARGICFAANLPGLGFTTLDVLCFGHEKPTLAMLNAGKGEWYYQSSLESVSRLGTLEQATTLLPAPALLAGNCDSLSGYGRLPITFPRADRLAMLAASSQKSAQELVPFYIRPPDAKPSSKNS